MQYIDFILNPQNDYLGQTIEYLKLCGVSIAVAIGIGVVLGALVSRNAILAFLAINVSGLMPALTLLSVIFVLLLI